MKKSPSKTPESVGKEYFLTELELTLVVSCMYRHYSEYVFTIIRASELGDYYPAEMERKEAYAKLCVILACSDFADQVLAYHFHAEKNCYICAESEEDTQFLQAAETLRGVTDTPLMAELKRRTAYTLWLIAGSWSGAMLLLGFDVLRDRELTEARKRYALNHASPELLTKKIRKKLSAGNIAALRTLCDNLRTKGKYPSEWEWAQVKKMVEPECSARRVLGEMGLAAYDPMKHLDPKPKGISSGWKARNYYWLYSDKYRALQRKSEEEVHLKQIKSDFERQWKSGQTKN